MLSNQNQKIDTRGQARRILDAIQQFSFVSFSQFWMEVLRESHDTQTYIQRRDLSLKTCSHKMNAFIAFLVNDCDALVKQSVKTAIQIRKKKFRLKTDVSQGRKRCLATGRRRRSLHCEKIKISMLEAMDGFWSEAEKRFNEICMVNEVFGFLNPPSLLRSGSIEEDMNKFRNRYADDVNFSELTLKIARFNGQVQLSGKAFQSDATALDVLQWLTKNCLCE